MARPPVPRHRLDAAMRAADGGTPLRDAAEEAGISFATLKRYRAKGPPPSPAKKTAKPAPTTSAPKPSRTPPRSPRGPAASSRTSDGPLPPSVVLGALAAGDEPDETLLQMLRAELRHAIAARRKATADDKPGAEAKWSKRIEELVRAVERLEPPPPPPPNLLQEELRRLDGECITVAEQHLPDKIDPAEVEAARKALAA